MRDGAHLRDGLQVQERDLQHLLGHKDLATTLLYRRSRDDRTRTAVEARDYDCLDTLETPKAKDAV
jgi:integrase